MLNFEFGQGYLWRDPESLTLIDTGTAGSAQQVSEAIRGFGLQREDLHRVVLTHYHPDHMGAAAELGSQENVSILAHRLDAPVIRSEAPEQPPVLTQEERPRYESIVPTVPPAPPARVDHELDDGDVLDFGGGAQVLSIPGHTAGSIAIYLPRQGVLFTGDTVAHVGGLRLGAFNIDRARTIESFRKLAELDTSVGCFGHGDPITRDFGAALRATAARLSG